MSTGFDIDVSYDNLDAVAHYLGLDPVDIVIIDGPDDMTVTLCKPGPDDVFDEFRLVTDAPESSIVSFGGADGDSEMVICGASFVAIIGYVNPMRDDCSSDDDMKYIESITIRAGASLDQIEAMVFFAGAM